MKHPTSLIAGILLLLFFLLFSQIYNTDNKKLGSGFTYDVEHKHILGKTDIPPTILSYAYDKQFIIVKQKPKKYNEAIYDKMEYTYSLGRDTVYYWLIIKKKQEVLGPLDYNKFKKLRDKYNVSDKLILK